MYKNILLLILCFSFSLLQGKESPNSLLVGTNAEFPPFCYIENKEIVGFDIDVAKEVARRLGKQIKFKDMPFDALIPDVVLGHVDFVAAGLSYTEERAKRVSFTKSYLSEDPLALLTSSQHSLGMDNLKGKTVVVVEGFTADFLMTSKEGINLIRLGNQTDGFMAIKSGRADAFVTAKSTVDAFFELQDPSLFAVKDIEGTGETCALVVPKSKPKMLRDIQQALDSMEADGTINQLKTKWKLR